MPTFEATRTWEDDLLSELEAAFAPTELHPPEETVTALRAAVACIPSQPVRHRQALPWTRRRWAAAGAVVAAVVAGPGIAFAAGAPVPPAVRNLATTIGLPVTPQPVVNAQNASATLLGVLQTTSPNPKSVAAAGRQLSNLYRQLDPPQKAQVGGSTPQLLQQACRYLLSAPGPLLVQELRTWPGCRAGARVGHGAVASGSGQGSAAGSGATAPGGAATSGGPSGGQTETGGAGTTPASAGGRAGTPSSGSAQGAAKNTGSGIAHPGATGQPGTRPGGAKLSGGAAAGSGAGEGAQEPDAGHSVTGPGSSNGVDSSTGRSSVANGT